MKKQLLWFGLILLLAGLMAPFFADFVREVVVIPLLYLVWIARVLFDAFPQANLWMLFLGLIGLILFLSLMDRRRSRALPPSPASPPPGRVEGWETLLRRAEQDEYFKWRLAQQLQRLTLMTLAHQRGQSFGEARQDLRHGRLALPSRLLAYFQASLLPLGYLPKQRQGFFSTKLPPTPLDLDPQTVVQFIETLHYGSEPEEKV